MLALSIIAVIAGIIGIIGSIVPGLPGPPISWVGLLLAYLTHGPGKDGDPMSLRFLMIWLVVTVAVSILDYVVPSYFTRVSGGTKTAGRGAIAGLIVGLLVPPVGIFVGTLLGAFLADFFIEDRGAWQSFKASIGAFLGFLCGTGMKLIACGMMFYYTIVFL